MQACCCAMAGTAACARCPQNYYANTPYGGYWQSPPEIDYERLAEEIAKRIKQ